MGSGAHLAQNAMTTQTDMKDGWGNPVGPLCFLRFHDPGRNI